MGISIIRSLAAVLLLAGAQAAPADAAPSLAERAVSFRDDFNTFNTANWRCEYTCPVIETGKARFRLKSGVLPNREGSWSKARYTGKRFTSGKFTVSFSLTERPKEPVWWGVALWDDGVNGKFNEINFGYTTNGQTYSDTQLRFESAKEGVDDYRKIDTGVDLYDGEYHTATLEYDANHVAFYFDGKKVGEITDKKFIPTAPMDFLLGPRLVEGAGLAKGFTESIDWVEIEG
ncbi:hypothetical protein NW759_012245 [Fusarium solani]|nr:hypothetical protein NW759_012245 [Fusarium solani]